MLCLLKDYQVKSSQGNLTVTGLLDIPKGESDNNIG
jgi:hypothetical protein